MELRSLRYLLATAEAGSVTQAAARLRVAQPAVSRQLQALEDEIGAQLLERTSRGVVLTDAGTAFVADVRALLAGLDQAVVAVKARARGHLGELQIGYAPSPTARILPAALSAFERTAPDVRLHVQDLAGDALLNGLADGTLNIALMVDPGTLCPDNIKFVPVRSYAQCVAFHGAHPFRKLRTIPVARVAQEPLVIYSRTEYAEYLHTLQTVLQTPVENLKIAVECDGISSLAAALVARRGVAVVPAVFSSVMSDHIQVRPIRPAPPPMVVGYAYRVDIPISPILRRFLPILQKLSQAKPSKRGEKE